MTLEEVEVLVVSQRSLKRVARLVLKAAYKNVDFIAESASSMQPVGAGEDLCVELPLNGVGWHQHAFQRVLRLLLSELAIV